MTMYYYTVNTQKPENGTVVPPGLFKYSSDGIVDADALFRERSRHMPNVPLKYNFGYTAR